MPRKKSGGVTAPAAAPVEENALAVIEFPRGGLTKDNFPAAVEFLERVEEMLEVGKKAVKGYVTAHGEGDLKQITLPDGRKYGYFEKATRTVPDVEGAVKALLAGGVDRPAIFGALTLAAGKMEKLGAGLDLSGYIQEKTGKTFGFVEEVANVQSE